MIIIPDPITRETFPALLNRFRCKTGVEIGVQTGELSEMVLRNWSGTLYLVDPWRHQDPVLYNDMSNQSEEGFAIVYAQAMAHIRPFGERAVVRRMMSHEAVEEFKDGSLDFVYIDANHSFDCVTQDLTLWTPKVCPDGIIGGHDFLYGGPNLAVKPAVKAFFPEGQEIHVGPSPWPVWWTIKS